MMEHQPAAYRLPWILFGALLVLIAAAYLRLWQLSWQLPIDDEWHALHKLLISDYRDIFLSFGYSDHSIPMSLYLKVMAETRGLDEWALHWPSLLFGLATVVAVPLLLGPWSRPREQLLFAGLLAISPLLIYYSRIARPYALSLLLTLVAMVACYRWWREYKLGWGAIFVITSALATWLLPLTVLFAFGVLTWCGLEALWQLRSGHWQALRRVLFLGLTATIPCALLLGPPLWFDFHAMVGKTGVHRLHADTLWVAWQLFTGTASVWLSVLILVLSLVGAVRLYQRDRLWLGCLIFVSILAISVISLLDAAWIQLGLVLARYLLPVQIVVLWLSAMGLWALLEQLPPVRWLTPAIPAGLLALLFLKGPLPEQYRGTNQLTAHWGYQFDYHAGRNFIRQQFASLEVPAVYAHIGAATESGWTLIEAPWRFESHHNPLYLYQREHGLPMRIGFISGLCTQDTLQGEFPPGDDRFRFQYLVSLADLLDQPLENHWVVFHREKAMEILRDLPDIEPCIQAFQTRFGDPWRENENHVVFRIGTLRDKAVP